MRLSHLFATIGVLLAANIAGAQSNPSWWKYTPPGATAIVGVHWDNLRQTLFAPAVATEIAPGGTLGFPDMEVLRNPDQMLIASPGLLIVEFGDFPLPALHRQAAALGMKKTLNKTTEIWTAADSKTLSVAVVSPKLVLVGSVADLQDALQRTSETSRNHSYSPLLARAARYSNEDLWVVASELPNPLASRFLPLEMDATAFEGSVSLWDGLHLVAAIERTTPKRAMDFADDLVESLATRPAMAQATEVTTHDRSVLVKMDLDEAAFVASLRTPQPELASTPPEPVMTASGIVSSPAPIPSPALAPTKPQPRPFVPPVAAKPSAPQVSVPTTLAMTMPAPEATMAFAPAPAPTLPPPPAKPKVIRILGLGDAPLEIPLGR